MRELLKDVTWINEGATPISDIANSNIILAAQRLSWPPADRLILTFSCTSAKVVSGSIQVMNSVLTSGRTEGYTPRP